MVSDSIISEVSFTVQSPESRVRRVRSRSMAADHLKPSVRGASTLRCAIYAQRRRLWRAPRTPLLQFVPPCARPGCTSCATEERHVLDMTTHMTGSAASLTGDVPFPCSHARSPSTPSPRRNKTLKGVKVTTRIAIVVADAHPKRCPSFVSWVPSLPACAHGRCLAQTKSSHQATKQPVPRPPGDDEGGTAEDVVSAN